MVKSSKDRLNVVRQGGASNADNLRSNTTILLVSILALAAFLRIYGLALVQFGIDEGIASAVSTQIANFKRFPLTGIKTSFGFYNPPTYLYLLAPFYAVSTSPLVPMVFQSCCSIFSVYLLYRAVREYAGVSAGLISALLLAVCPNAVEHSRRLWGHDLQVFLSVLVLFFSVRLWLRKEWIYVVFAGLTISIAQSLHLSALILWPFLLSVTCLSLEKKGALKGIAGAAVALFVVYLPWIIHEFQNQFMDTRLIFSTLMSGDEKDLGLPIHPSVAWIILLGDFWKNDLLGYVFPAELSRSMLWTSAILSGSASILLFAGLFSAVHPFRIKLRSREQGLVLSAAGVVVLSPILFGLILSASVPYYHLPVLPFAIFLSAFWLKSLLKMKQGRITCYTLLAVYGTASTFYSLNLKNLLSDGAGLTPSLQEKMTMISGIGDLNEDQPYYVYQDARSVSTGIDVAYVYLLYAEGLNDLGKGTPDQAEKWYLIHHQQVSLPPDHQKFLNTVDNLAFDNLTLFILTSEEQQQWSHLLDEIRTSQ